MDFPFFCKFTQIADETIVVFLQFFVKLPKTHEISEKSRAFLFFLPILYNKPAACLV